VKSAPVSPQATVGAVKQRRLIIAAEHFLLKHPSASGRFDVVAITGHPPRIEWITNAFEAG